MKKHVQTKLLILFWIIFLSLLEFVILCFFLKNLQMYGPVSSMKCPTSKRTVHMVDNCPKSFEEWKYQENKKNCSAITQNCTSKLKFRYHCVLNGDGTHLIEVCAPFKFIHGKYSWSLACIFNDAIGVHTIDYSAIAHFEKLIYTLYSYESTPLENAKHSFKKPLLFFAILAHLSWEYIVRRSAVRLSIFFQLFTCSFSSPEQLN